MIGVSRSGIASFRLDMAALLKFIPGTELLQDRVRRLPAGERARWIWPPLDRPPIQVNLLADNAPDIPRTQTGDCVYLVVNVANGDIKIGRSRDAFARLAELQVGCSSELKLLAFMPAERLPPCSRTTAEYERYLHEALSEHRVRGEWFAGNEAVLWYLNGLPWEFVG